VRTERISVVHQPMPVSPKEPSLIFGMGAPVIIGPMNGGIDYPPAFRKMQGTTERVALAIGRSFATVMNTLLPGKRRAAMLLVANERTRKALPPGVCRRVETLVENGVDLTLWHPTRYATGGETHGPSGPTRYIFVGRLVDWKGVDLLLHSFKRAAAILPMSLAILGDGVERARLEQLARDLDIFSSPDQDLPGKVRFLGWMTQANCAAQLQRSDALVLPSLMECGGAVVLEAMAVGLPAIATDWGGPADYIDASCGILVPPTSRPDFIDNLAGALVRLAESPEIRAVMGKAAHARILQHFDWEVKIDHILLMYHNAITCPEHQH